ncbi:hypothetical protein EZV62_013828 [Acer yangbiense]|uniref:F-box domain-containing protein n=1 Tax=Acer yangbiense TaxID=1000413 RepID=A0A5C7HR32_9ROSI|nr:hypothetical protein EZV62_013828 [Acer yangbiense]
MKKTRSVEEVDLISELPEGVLHKILSFLQFKEIVQTSVLSTRWEEVWRTYPDFTIDVSVFGSDIYEYLLYGCEGEDDEKIRRKKMNLYVCLERLLRNRLSIEKFKFEFGFFSDPEFESFLHSCVCYAIGSNIKKMKLEFFVSKYHLPPIVLCSKSIEVLKLRGCEVELPTESNVKLPSLRKLHLFRIDCKDHVISNLFSGCPLIEEMICNSCEGLGTVKLFGLYRLNKIKLVDNWDLKAVYIKNSNVTSLTVSGSTPFKISVYHCMNLRKISLELASIKDDWLCKTISELLVLESLKLGFCHELKSIKISSSSLKKLKIKECPEVVKLQIDTPNLSVFSYSGCMLSFSSNALALSNIDLFFDVTRSQWHERYVKFLAQLNHFAEILDLKVYRAEDVIIPQESRRILHCPLSSVKHLNLNIWHPMICVSFSIAKVMDSLLWIAPHTRAVCVTLLAYNHPIRWHRTSFEVLYIYILVLRI